MYEVYITQVIFQENQIKKGKFLYFINSYLKSG